MSWHLKRSLGWLGLASLIVACGHSDPIGQRNFASDGPFAPAQPIRLTYSLLGDGDAAFSADEQWITYQFDKGTADRDRCVGVLPSSGGSRRWEHCASASDQASRSEGIGSAALRSDGVLAYTLHSGPTTGMTTHTAALYLAPVDSVAGAIAVMPLMVTPPGGSEPWQDLVDPVWISEDELLVLAARRLLINASCPSGCPFDFDRNPSKDTLQLGIEIAKIRLSGSAAVVTAIAGASDAVAWSADTSDASLYLVIQRAASPDDVYHESIADTLYQIPIGGGARTLRYGVPRVGSDAKLERLHGVAAAAGRVYLSRSWREPSDVDGASSIPIGTPLRSDIIELLPDGTTRVVAPAVSWRWGRIRVSADGKRLLAEAVERNSSDVYLIEVTP